MKNKCLKFAVTGGIGSGKSYALNILKEAGYFTVSCDEVYSELFESASFKRKLKKLFPTVVSGVIRLRADRKKLAELVFKDETARKKLNEFTHPLIIKECFNRAEKGGSSLCFIEVPLLFEGGYQDSFDGVIIISRDRETRVNSVIKRSKLTREQVLDRMLAQVDYDALDKTPYIVIENDDNVKEKLLGLVKRLKEKSAE